jgi:hypothetical protein
MHKSSRVKIEGFTRIHILNPDGTLHGDSGWVKNQITTAGRLDYLCNLLANTTGSKQVSHVALGTYSSAIQPADTALSGELGTTSNRRVAPAVTVLSSSAVRFAATFTSGFVSTTTTLNNIGLFHTSSGGTMFAGNTYASSTCASNQAVNCSYQINFTTS